MKKSPKEYFESKALYLNQKDIVNLSKNEAGQLHAVIAGIEKEAFGVQLIEDNNCQVSFAVFYVGSNKSLEGYYLPLLSSDKIWQNHVLYFSAFLSREYEHLNSIDIYNTLIGYSRLMFEKQDYTTITNFELNNLSKFHSHTFLTTSKGVILIEYVDKLTIYKDLFEENRPTDSRENKIYLMYSKSSKFIKIGRSVNPTNREKTLQGEDPKLTLIKSWVAPKQVEKELHDFFISKRVRGEWFNLDISDLIKIRNHMSKY